MHFRRLRTLFLFVASLFALFAVPSAASADSTRWLPGMPGFGDMVIDETNGQVFISPGKNGSRILVRNLDGSANGEIASQPGATGMVLDGTKLYVALCDQSAISVINTVTRAEIERISLGTIELTGTCDITIAGGRLWVPNSDQHANLTSVTVAAPHTIVPNALAGGSVYEPIFPSITTPPSSLIVGTEGLSPSTWYTYNIGVSPATVTTSVQVGSNLQDGAIPASGSHIVSASGSPYYGQRHALPALTPAGTYSTSNYPKATAVTADGAWVAIGRSSDTRDVYVFPAGSPTAVREFSLGGTNLDPRPMGVRMNAAATKLYVIGSDSAYDGNIVLGVFDSPTTGALQPPPLTLPPAPSASPAPAASAQFPLTGLTKVTSLVVDPTNSRIFVAPGQAGSAIQVRNLDGSAAGTITDTPGATSMVLSGGRLYVSLCGWNAIEVIDAATLAKIERIDLGTATMSGKCTLGLAGGRLFYPERDQHSLIRSVSVATPHTFVANVLNGTRYQPTFSTSPAQPNRLLIAETGVSSTELEAYTVGASTVTLESRRDVDASSSALTASAQGTHVGLHLRDLLVANMAITTTYSGEHGSSAYSADGNWFATLVSPWSTRPEINVYARGDNEARRSFELVTSGEVYPGAIAFGPTGDKLYAVASPTYSPGAPALFVVNNPTAAGVAYPANSVAPSVSGSAMQGSTLTCAPGTWSGSPSYTYTWQRDGAGIYGATAATYVSTASDVSKAVSCIARATNAKGAVSALASNSIAVTPPPPPPANSVLPAISGTATQGATLTCAPGTWSGSPTFGYQWRRGASAISGATGTTYVVTASDIAASVTCAVTGTNAGGATTATSAAVVPTPPAPTNQIAPAITGTATEGSTLTCGRGTWTGTPTYAYQWRRNGAPISGATTVSYVNVSADVAATITCAVTATNAGGIATATSAGVVVTAPASNAPVNQTLPVITGTPVAGARLSCAPGAWTQSPTYTFAWNRDGTPIVFATAATYDIDPADVGTELTCVVTAASSGETTTVASGAIAIGTRPLNVALPTITGAPAVGATLTCAPGTWSISVTHHFAWTRDGMPQAISANTYTVTSADTGSTIRCSVQGRSAYGNTTATSAGLLIGSGTSTTPAPTGTLPTIPPPTVIPNTPRVPTSATPTVPLGDTEDEDDVAPVVTLTGAPQRLATALKSGLLVKSGCNEACTTIVRLELTSSTARRLGLKNRILTTTAVATPNLGANAVTIRIPRSVRAKLAASTTSVTVMVRAFATDRAGNVTTKLKLVRLSR